MAPRKRGLFFDSEAFMSNRFIADKRGTFDLSTVVAITHGGRGSIGLLYCDRRISVDYDYAKAVAQWRALLEPVVPNPPTNFQVR
jgi:hypothetical protein